MKSIATKLLLLVILSTSFSIGACNRRIKKEKCKKDLSKAKNMRKTTLKNW